MQRCWQALQEVHGPKLHGAELLYKLSGTTPALLVYTVTNWLQDGCPSDVYSFVREQNYDKLLSEVSASALRSCCLMKVSASALPAAHACGPGW